MWAVVGGGLVALVELAVAVGLAIDRRSLTEAWSRVSVSRRTNFEKQRELQEFALALDVRDADLDLRERRVEFREERLFQFEEQMRLLEQDHHRNREFPPDLTA